MDNTGTTSGRLGAISLGLGGLAFLAGLSHPVQNLSDKPGTLQLISSSYWVVGHLLLISGDVLLVFGVLALYDHLRTASPRASLVATMLAIAGICLSLPLFGVLAVAMPVLGDHADFAAANALFGSAAFPALLGSASLLQAIAGVLFAVIAWRAELPTRLGFVVFAAGLLVLTAEPALPRAGHIVAGAVLAAGALWLAFGLLLLPGAKSPAWATHSA